jgi:cell division control protein 42
VLLVCFSVVNPTSFENVQEKWIPELKRYCPGVPFLLVGTQCDLRTDQATLAKLSRSKATPVSQAEAERVAKREKAVGYVECSAKTLKNVKQVFDEALVAVVCPSEGKKACAIF